LQPTPRLLDDILQWTTGVNADTSRPDERKNRRHCNERTNGRLASVSYITSCHMTNYFNNSLTAQRLHVGSAALCLPCRMMSDSSHQSVPRPEIVAKIAGIFHRFYLQSRPAKLCNVTTRSQFFTERVIDIWNSLPCDVADFFTLSAYLIYKHCLEMVDLSIFCSLV